MKGSLKVLRALHFPLRSSKEGQSVFGAEMRINRLPLGILGRREGSRGAKTSVLITALAEMGPIGPFLVLAEGKKEARGMREIKLVLCLRALGRA